MKLFANWRHAPGTQTKTTDFVLNRPPFTDAGTFLVGRNFGGGSSLEAAV